MTVQQVPELEHALNLTQMSDAEAFALAQAELRLELKAPKYPLVASVELYWREQALRVRDRVLLIGLLRCQYQWSWGWAVHEDNVIDQLTGAEIDALALPEKPYARSAVGEALRSFQFRFNERFDGFRPMLVKPWLWPEMPEAYRLDWAEAIWLGTPQGEAPAWDRSPLPAPEGDIAEVLDGVQVI